MRAHVTATGSSWRSLSETLREAVALLCPGEHRRPAALAAVQVPRASASDAGAERGSGEARRRSPAETALSAALRLDSPGRTRGVAARCVLHQALFAGLEEATPAVVQNEVLRIIFAVKQRL